MGPLHMNDAAHNKSNHSTWPARKTRREVSSSVMWLRRKK